MRLSPAVFAGLSLALTLTAPTAASAKPAKEIEERAVLTLEKGTASADFATRAMAVAGLGHAPKKTALPFVQEALKDQQWQVRRAAIEALLALKEKQWDQAIAAAMRTEALDAGGQVLPLLEPLGTKAAMALMAKTLGDAKFPRPERYARALAVKGGEWMVEGFRMGLKLKGPARDAFLAQLDKLPLPDALPLYKDVLLKEDVAVQKRVLDYVLASPKVKDLEFVKPLLKSKDAGVAFRVAVALAERGDASGKAILIKAVGGEAADWKLAAMKALKGIASTDLFDLIKPFTQEDNVDLELLRAAYAIYAAAGHPRLAAHLESRIAGTDLERRAAAVTILGKVKGREALPTLHPLLGDGAKIMRIGAARSIGDLGDGQSIPHLRDALFREADTDVKVAFIEALGAIADPECVSVLRFQITDPELAVRAAAVKAMGGIRHVSAVQDLEIALRDQAPELRRVALAALLTIDAAGNLEHYRSALGWLAPEDVEALAAAHAREFRPHLEAALASDRDVIRAAALAASAHLEAGARAELLSSVALTGNRTDLRIAALRQVVALQGKGSAELLKTLAADKEPLVKVAAMEALGRMGAKDAQAMLFEATNDTDERVRVAAAAALLRL